MHPSGPRRPRRRAIALCALVIAGGAVVGGSTAGAGSAPDEVAGDHHSQRVAGFAAAALEAWSVYDRTDDAADRNAYRDALAATATATAHEFDVSGLQMEQAWTATDEDHQVAMLTALSQLGKPYASSTSDPDVGFDCSGLMLYAWGAAGVALSRSSGSQISEADPREMGTALAGDLAQYPGHVMMYLGVPQTFVHASNPQNDVELWMTSPERARGLRYGDPTE